MNRQVLSDEAMTDAVSAAMYRPPVGGAFVGFVAAIVSVLGMLVVGQWPSVPPSAATQLGVMAVTLFGAAGLLCAYRAATGRDPLAAVLAGSLVLSAVWSWLAFVATAGAGEASARLAGVGGAAAAIVFLTRGFRSARWLEVFSGLGLLAVALSAGSLHSGVEASLSSSAAALLAALAGMTSLYGLLVDLELAGHRSEQQLLRAKLELETESRRMSDLLHDLRSGLLSIEAATGTEATSVADPVRWEAARLRRLTIRGALEPARFDLVSGVLELVAAKRSAGLDIIAHAPATAMVEGVEAELLSVVENLLSNAQRHGRTPITVELTDDGRKVKVAVTDSGDGVPTSDADRVFRRGYTSHAEGSGVGLSRARRLAGRNGATLSLDTSGVGGTTFVLTMTSAAAISVS